MHANSCNVTTVWISDLQSTNLYTIITLYSVYATPIVTKHIIGTIRTKPLLTGTVTKLYNGSNTVTKSKFFYENCLLHSLREIRVYTSV